MLGWDFIVKLNELSLQLKLHPLVTICCVLLPALQRHQKLNNCAAISSEQLSKEQKSNLYLLYLNFPHKTI